MMHMLLAYIVAFLVSAGALFILAADNGPQGGLTRQDIAQMVTVCAIIALFLALMFGGAVEAADLLRGR